eukprot:scaffold1829_cov194-Ochromonas_danica.AAC.16
MHGDAMRWGAIDGSRAVAVFCALETAQSACAAVLLLFPIFLITWWSAVMSCHVVSAILSLLFYHILWFTESC